MPEVTDQNTGIVKVRRKVSTAFGEQYGSPFRGPNCPLLGDLPYCFQPGLY